MLVGSSGHAKVLAELLSAAGRFEAVGFIDRDPSRWAKKVLGLEVFGGDDLLPGLLARGVKFAVVAVAGTGGNRKRSELFTNLKNLGFDLPALLHPAASISRSATLEEGTQVMQGCIICPDSAIGANTIVNTGVLVEHDYRIGRNCNLALRSALMGGVEIGDNTHVGAGAIINECVSVGKDVIIGSGTVVIKDVPNGLKVAGVPAKPIGRLT